MYIYTVSFFGHRYVDYPTEIGNRLDNLLHELIMQREYVEFLIGRDGDRRPLIRSFKSSQICTLFTIIYTAISKRVFLWFRNLLLTITAIMNFFL